MEMHVEGLITDLAFILLLGAAVTLLFKKIKQPVVLGYIVAGFLASPNFEYLPSVTTMENIDFWAEVGIIIMLFCLGLEFSFKKLLNVGGSAVVTCCVIFVGMGTLGYSVGRLWGFNDINCLFLGGMVSMSSTTIIIKAFNDLGVKQKKFASLVFGVLIVEDLFAVLMMVILSSMALQGSADPEELLTSVGRLVFFLVMWFLVGVLLLPSFLNTVRRHLNQETLLIVSIGLCFGMAIFSKYCGFSMELGAFVMGSILAGTSLAEKIERVTVPVKDLFGAVFFISVGMLVDPAMLIKYWDSVLILALMVMTGGIVFGTSGMLITGQPLKIAMQSGFSLTQIGEFSFIIATLGLSLGVLQPELYPIIVAVSVLTTFISPYLIKAAEPAYSLIEKRLPKRLHFLIDRYATQASTEASNTTKSLWATALKRYSWRVSLYSIVLIAICLSSSKFLMPWLETRTQWAEAIGCAVTLAAMAPFLLALALPASAQTERSRLDNAAASIDIPLIVTSVFRFTIALGFVIYALSDIVGLRIGFSVGIAVVMLVLLLLSSRIKKRTRDIESKFFNNLNERELRRSGKNNNVISDLHLAFMEVGYGCPFVGERLRNSNLRRNYGVNIISIQRGGESIPLPNGDTRIFPGDTIGVIGTDEQIQALLPDVETQESDKANANNVNPTNFKLTSIKLSENSPILGESATTANLSQEYTALVVALQRNDSFLRIDGTERFQPDDIVWLVGDPALLSAQ